VVNRKNLRDSKFVEATLKHAKKPGTLLVKIDRFSFTSNNVLYGVLGERNRYWELFPASGDDGIIPAWSHTIAISASERGSMVFSPWRSSSRLSLRTSQRRDFETLPRIARICSSFTIHMCGSQTTPHLSGKPATFRLFSGR